MSFERTVTSRGHKYRQLVENKWDPIKKASKTHVIKHLGTVVEKDGEEKLIPSSKKYDYIESSCQIGTLAIYWQLAQEYSILSAILKSFNDPDEKKDVANGIFLLVLNQLMGRKPLSKIGSWVASTPLPRWMDINPDILTKDFFISALDAISVYDGENIFSNALVIQRNCFNVWGKNLKNGDSTLFFYKDTTRIRYNSNKNYWAEKGYGAQAGRPHIGFGLVANRDDHMPVMGFPVRGSHHDTTTISYTTKVLEKYNLKNIVLVWDRGYVSEKNVLCARNGGYHVISGGSFSSDEVKDAVTKHSDSEIEKRSNVYRMSKGKGIYFKDWIGNLYGQECRVVVILDPDRRNRERVDRDMLIQELINTSNKKRKQALINLLKPIVKKSRGRNGYIIQEDEEKRLRNLDGRSLIFSTDTTIDAREIIKIYFQKDIIEKAFRILKGIAKLSPIRYQLPGHIDGYLSVVGFIAYELIAAAMLKIKEKNLKISFEELLDEAKKIYEVELVSKGKKTYEWTHMTKKVQALFKPFKITSLKS